MCSSLISLVPHVIVFVLVRPETVLIGKPESLKVLSTKDSATVWKTLTQREKDVIGQLDMSFWMKYNQMPQTSPSLFYFLGDNFEYGKAWTASNGRLPTYRTGKGRFFHRQTGYFLTGKDKLASLGWPMDGECAMQMGTKILPGVDSQRSHHLAGNSMHLSVASMVLLLALVCFKEKQNS